ncbi:MAG: hypothetical protein ABFC96_00210 [Thermoguttaceae bacterium]
MMRPQTIYKLEAMSPDVPKYEAFAFKEDKSFLGNDWLWEDFRPLNYGTRDLATTRLAAVWKPLEVIGRVRKCNDYPCSGSPPIFSQRAVDALRDLLEPNGELLPLVSKLGNYYAYNITTLVDALDRNRSQIEWLKDQVIAGTIERYEFIPERLEGLSVFRIIESWTDVYITEAFAARVRECHLDGFNMIPVWPLPQEVSWEDLRRESWRKQEGKESPKALPIKGNTVLLRLPLAGKGDEPSAAEKTQVDRLMDELDALLADPDATTPSAGSLEGSEYVAGECRLFLSCPDADALVVRLWPWLKALRWNGNVWVMKRWGEYVDVSAPEEYVDLSAASPPQSTIPRRKAKKLAELGVRDRPLTNSEAQEVESFTAKGLELVGLEPDAEPDHIVERIQTWLEDHRAGTNRSPMNDGDTALALGCAWGLAVCRKLDWQWVAIDRRKREIYGVVSPKREYAVYPMQNMHAILLTPAMGIGALKVYNLVKHVMRKTRLEPFSYQTVD